VNGAAAQIAELASVLRFLTPAEMAEVDGILAAEQPIWVPQPGPQTLAFESEADIVYYGGAAGGGKTDLLIGLALTQHRRSIIFRREGTQLLAIIDRTTEVLGTRDGYNGQEHVWRLPKLGRQVELGSCKDLGDEIRYQGRPHDLICVGRGTPVWMADGSWKPVEDVKVGDLVDTLEGSRRVSQLHVVSKPAALVSASINGRVIGQQVQSRNHSILTTDGWASRDTFYESPRPLSFSPTSLRAACISEGSSSPTYGRPPLSPGVRSLDPGRLRALCQYLSGCRSPLGWSADTAYKAQDIFREVWNERLSGAARRALSHLLTAMLPVPSFALSASGLQDPPSSRGIGGGPSFPLPQGSPVNYSIGTRRYGGPSPPAGVRALICLRPQGDVGRRIPKGFAGGAPGVLPRRIHRIRWYDHPYTMERRQTQADVSPALVSFSDLPETELFDLTVESVNHYITGAGFVNKNCFDEITHFFEQQFRFLAGWLRTTTPGQRCRVVCAGNPPTNQDGQWVVKFWAPWLDDKHPNPAKPGELRWYAMIDGEEIERPDGALFVHNGETIQPQSRTFIPSKVQDNAFLMSSGYVAQLQALPEPLRSQMLRGDFKAGTEDSAWQVIPTAWIDAAMARWTPEGGLGRPMDSMGVDVARGGKDKTVLAMRHGTWYAPLKRYPGAETPDGGTTAGLVVANRRDGAPVHVDVVGVGGSVVDHLESNDVQVVAVNGGDREGVEGQTDKMTNRLKFRNKRAMLWWRFRESLDPKIGDNIALPNDSQLRADLCAPMWKLTPGGILVEPKEDGPDGPGIKKRLGRSPDDGDAVVNASICTVKVSPKGKDWRAKVKRGSSWRSQ